MFNIIYVIMFNITLIIFNIFVKSNLDALDFKYLLF